ncbi:MAG: dipeptidase D, partial [bacterium]
AGSRAYRLKVSGLRGGHSGIDIAAGRGNAIRVLAQVLNALQSGFGFEVASITGGNKRNAIPREASAVLFLLPGQEGAFKAALAEQEAHWRSAFGAFDPGLVLGLAPSEGNECMSAADAQAIVGVLLSSPHGVEAMSPDIAGLVQTSTNLGTSSRAVRSTARNWRWPSASARFVRWPGSSGNRRAAIPAGSRNRTRAW